MLSYNAELLSFKGTAVDLSTSRAAKAELGKRKCLWRLKRNYVDSEVEVAPGTTNTAKEFEKV